MSNRNVRRYSFDVLYWVFYDGKLLNIELNSCFDNNDLSEEDKSFIKRECTGVVEKLDNIDNTINEYSKLKTNKLKKDILLALRLGTYELKFMEKVPDYAVVNEYVNIVKATKYKNLSGYVNAVLKNIAREKTKSDSFDNEHRAYFKIYYDKEETVLNELNEKNINYNKYDGELPFKYTKVYYVDKYKYVLDLDSFKNGYILIEDASSAFLSDALCDCIISNFGENVKICVLDTCASPGGKILALYDLLNNKYNDAYFEARDISEDKISRIKDNIDRLNAQKIKTKVCDATIYNNDDFEAYNIIICDVPCSGLGVINKKPDIKLNFNDEKLKSLVGIQRQILEVSKSYVKKGGILSYSTCTETKEENEDNIKHFLDNNQNFEIVFEKKIYHGDSNKSDGFYICFMKKK